jgi:2-haloalkanoic acid dehalogenase type II
MKLQGGNAPVIKAVVFDGNGTLFRGLSKPAAIQRALKRFGITRGESEIELAFNTARSITQELKDKGLLRLGKEAYLLETSVWLYLLDAYTPGRAKKIDAAWPHLAQKRLYPDAMACLKKLAGQYKLALLTAGSERAYAQILRENRVRAFFPVVVGEDTVNHAKPKVTVYQYVCRKLGVRPQEALMVGDDFENDYAAPKRAGMRAVFLCREKAARKRGLMIRSLKELPRTIEAMR